jgi:pilus assembly protein CpaB
MRRPTIFLMLAMVAAVLAAIVVFSALKNREAQVQVALAQTQDIVVAARDVQLGEKITAADLKLARWSRQSVPQGSFSDPSMVVNSYPRAEIVEGQPLVQRNLIQSDRIPGVLPMIIAPGMRAMSIAVDEVSDISGFVKPHTRVDVLVAVSGTGVENNKPFSKIVLQNIEVIAVAQQIDKGKDEAEVAKVVTLLVTPHQAEKLSLAGREGVLRLAMRNYNDDKMVATAGSDYADLLGAGGSMTMPVSAAQPASIDMPPRRIGGGPVRHPFAVEIMRDGKNAETLSFVSASASDNTVRGDRRVTMAAPVMPPSSVAPSSTDASGAAVAAPPPASPVSLEGAPSTSLIPVPKAVDLQ